MEEELLSTILDPYARMILINRLFNFQVKHKRNVNENLVCKLCDKLFASQNRLKKHMETHGPPQEKRPNPHTMQRNPRQFVYPLNLNLSDLEGHF